MCVPPTFVSNFKGLDPRREGQMHSLELDTVDNWLRHIRDCFTRDGCQCTAHRINYMATHVNIRRHRRT